MNWTTRDLVLLAVFGALWGGLEMTLGAALKSLNLPLSGVILAGLGLFIALTGRHYVPKPGSTFFVGAIALLLKLFSLGGVIIGPMMAIFMEALLAEIVLSLWGASGLSFMLAGALGVSWSVVQPFVTGPLLFGRALVDVWTSVIVRAAAILHLPPHAVWLVLTAFLAVHMLAGAAVGWFAWRLGPRLHQRSAWGAET